MAEDSAALWEKECASYEQVKNVSREKLAAYSELSFTLLKEMEDKKTCALKLAAVAREETHIHELRKSIAGLKKELEQKEGEVLKARLLPQFLMNLFVTVSNYSVLEEAEKTVIPVLTIFPFVSYLLGDGVLPGSFTGKLSIRAEKKRECDSLAQNQKW